MINRKKTGEFHFVVNDKMKDKLENLSGILGLSLSKTVIYILDSAAALTNKMHLIYSEENNKVERVNWSEHIHVYVPKNNNSLCNMLKSIHKDNNTYSMALILRYIIKVFLRGVDLFGLKPFISVLKNAVKRWEARIMGKKEWRKQSKVRQLSLKPYYNVKYSTRYTAILIKFLN